MRRISIRNKLYISIVPIIVIGVILSFAMLYYIANDKYSDYLQRQYEQEVDYLISVSTVILKTGNIPQEEHINLPDSCSGIRVYDLNGNSVYEQSTKNNMMNDISCCDFIAYEIDGYGKLEIYSHCAVDSTEDSLDFRQDLIWVIIITGSITLLISLFVINRIANKMSVELNGISEFAGKMESGLVENSGESDIKEIDNIKNSLHNLGVRLSEKERLRKEKIDLIKHQINTPLTIIKTTLEGMIDDVIDLDKEYINRCLVENDRIKEKLDNLYYDIENSTDVISIKKINLGELLKGIIESFRVSFSQKGVKLIEDLKELTLETDENLLISSIYNILSNAYKYTNKGDTVSITIDNKLIITDSGVGIREKDKEKIFDAYYRGSNVMDTKGKGLGLYDTKNMLEKLGYKIYLDTNQKHTTFIIDFGLDK